MKRGKIIILTLGIFLISVSQEGSLSHLREVPSSNEIRGFNDGKFDKEMGRSYLKGFYNPPREYENYWKGYDKGFKTNK